MTSVSKAYPCLVPLGYLGATYLSFEYPFFLENRTFYSAHIRKQSHGYEDRNFLHELTAYFTWAKVGENLIMNEWSLVPHWFGMDVSSLLGINKSIEEINN